MIEYLDENNFVSKVLKTKDEYCINYYSHRWNYISIVIEELKKINPKTILELGSYKINLTNISDNIDLYVDLIDSDNINNKIYIQDATKTPYKIDDSYYDVFVGLQVFEHLNDKQSEVFNEIMRISKKSILSFPYKWNCPTDITHHNIDKETIKKWTNNIEPENIIIINNIIIYIFNFKNNINNI